ncbi:uncharacterized protein HD556DRAFT_1304479 [Suillus plorans]|uniref:Uncharacterized protein n=1 Tax=Suillus plorans TaxID=116603 RepID=A0A9P7DRN0_9AGAM|nr:uncharacterized protein HD556DRAFT_1304479 [Suillus plorans]KAG1801354.1 hypothetical protein HD556DRAFT_1304479 [Suillus plorans]
MFHTYSHLFNIMRIIPRSTHTSTCSNYAYLITMGSLSFVLSFGGESISTEPLSQVTLGELRQFILIAVNNFPLLQYITCITPRDAWNLLRNPTQGLENDSESTVLKRPASRIFKHRLTKLAQSLGLVTIYQVATYSGSCVRTATCGAAGPGKIQLRPLNDEYKVIWQSYLDTANTIFGTHQNLIDSAARTETLSPLILPTEEEANSQTFRLDRSLGKGMTTSYHVEIREDIIYNQLPLEEHYIYQTLKKGTTFLISERLDGYWKDLETGCLDQPLRFWCSIQSVLHGHAQKACRHNSFLPKK